MNGTSNDPEQSAVDDLKVVRVTDGVTHSPSVWGLETTLWPTAARNVCEWSRGVLEGAGRLLARKLEEKSGKNRHHVSVVGEKGRWGGGRVNSSKYVVENT